MRILFVCTLALSALLGSSPAWAACALPFTFTNGQTADATQVMANYNALLSCINSGVPAGSTNSIQYNAGGALGGVGPLTDGQFVIGSTGNAPQVGTLNAGSGIAITNGAGNITISATAGGIGGPYNKVLSSTPTSAGTGLTAWLNQGSGTVTDSAVGLVLKRTIAAANAAFASTTSRNRALP